MLKIGQGLDIHPLNLGKGIWLGGIFISCDYSIISHSDGDVLFHSISNAFLSALGLEDIGHFFPDNEKKNKDISSKIILEYAYQKVITEGYQIQNLSNTIICEASKLAGYRLTIIQNISKILNLKKNQVSVHFGTSEKLGFIGRKEGLLSSSIVLISK